MSPRDRRRIALLAAVSTVTVAGVVAAFYAGGRWGCPSQAELERARAPREVLAAFADRELRLDPAALPRAVVRDDGAYQGAFAYRYVTTRAALFVLVCKARCVSAPRGLGDRPVAVPGRSRQYVRQFSTLGNNIAFFVTDRDRHSGQDLQRRVQPVLNGLDAAVRPGSRCYVQ